MTPHKFANDFRDHLRLAKGFTDSAKLNHAQALYDAGLEHLREHGGSGRALTRENYEKAREFMFEHRDTKELRSRLSERELTTLDTALKSKLGIKEDAA